MPERLEFEFADGSGSRICGLFNFEDEARDLGAPLPPGRWHAVELWEERALGTFEGGLELALVASHACRVVRLSRATEMPAIVATTGHIGMGAVDMLDALFEPSTGVLGARLLPVGRARRRVFVSHANAVVAAEIDGRNLEVVRAQDLCYVDITVEEVCAFSVTYRWPPQGRTG